MWRPKYLPLEILMNKFVINLSSFIVNFSTWCHQLVSTFPYVDQRQKVQLSTIGVLLEVEFNSYFKPTWCLLTLLELGELRLRQDVYDRLCDGLQYSVDGVDARRGGKMVPGSHTGTVHGHHSVLTPGVDVDTQRRVLVRAFHYLSTQ